MTPIDIVFHFEQQVNLMTRESDRRPIVSESFRREGVILVSVSVVDGRWVRTISEYEMAPANIQAVREAVSTPRSQMEETHDALIKARKNRFGLELPVELSSNMANSDIRIGRGGESRPVKFEMLYLPTVLPILPPRRAEPGMEWKGSINVGAGAGEFALPLAFSCTARPADKPTIEFTFEDRPVSATVRTVTLICSAKGKGSAALTPADGCPLNSQSNFQIAVRAKTVREGDPVDVEVLNCQMKTTLTRIPAGFNDENFLSGGWRLAPEKPNSP